LQLKILVYFMTIWSIIRPLEIFYGHLVYFVVIWYISPRLAFCTKKNLATLGPTRIAKAGSYMSGVCATWMLFSNFSATGSGFHSSELLELQRDPWSTLHGKQLEKIFTNHMKKDH
jgi:hypothetical protein